MKFDDTYIYLEKDPLTQNFDDVHGDNLLESVFKDEEMDGIMNEPLEQVKI
jgi:hypothetical protein